MMWMAVFPRTKVAKIYILLVPPSCPSHAASGTSIKAKNSSERQVHAQRLSTKTRCLLGINIATHDIAETTTPRPTGRKACSCLTLLRKRHRNHAYDADSKADAA